MGAGQGESLIRQATTSLKPGGGATCGPGLVDTHDDVESDSSSMALLHSLACRHWALFPRELQLH